MHNSTELKELSQALAQFQTLVSDIKKDGHVDVLTREGKKYSYDYATLENLLGQVRKLLAQQGLSITQHIEGECNKSVRITTLLLHNSGQWLQSSLDLMVEEMRGKGWIQSVGATISYGRRYALMAILGITQSEESPEDEGEGDIKKASPKRINAPVKTIPVPAVRPSSVDDVTQHFVLEPTLNELKEIAFEKLDTEGIAKMLEYYKVGTFHELTEKQALQAIKRLKTKV